MTEYTQAWLIYAGAASVAMLMAYLLIRKLKPTWLSLLLQSLIAALMLTPVAIEGHEGLWAPAYMSAAMEFMSGDSALAVSRLWSLAAVMLIIFVLALVTSFLKTRLTAKNCRDRSS